MGSIAYQKNKRHIAKYQSKIRDYVQQAKFKPCADCGIQYPFYVMEFDHVRGEKKFNISSWPGKSLKTVKEEIEKCEVVCSNCHAHRTWSRSFNLSIDEAALILMQENPIKYPDMEKALDAAALIRLQGSHFGITGLMHKALEEARNS